MKILRQIIFTLVAVVGLSMAVLAQKQEPKKPPPKDPPPVIKPGDKTKPKDNPPPRDDKPKKPGMAFAFRSTKIYLDNA